MNSSLSSSTGNLNQINSSGLSPAALAAAQQLNPSQIQRNLAEIEYDWLAAVIERLFLLIFCTLFFFMSFGINGIGLYWYITMKDNIAHRWSNVSSIKATLKLSFYWILPFVISFYIVPVNKLWEIYICNAFINKNGTRNCNQTFQYVQCSFFLGVFCLREEKNFDSAYHLSCDRRSWYPQALSEHLLPCIRIFFLLLFSAVTWLQLAAAAALIFRWTKKWIGGGGAG